MEEKKCRHSNKAAQPPPLCGCRGPFGRPGQLNMEKALQPPRQAGQRRGTTPRSRPPKVIQGSGYKSQGRGPGGTSDGNRLEKIPCHLSPDPSAAAFARQAVWDICPQCWHNQINGERVCLYTGVWLQPYQKHGGTFQKQKQGGKQGVCQPPPRQKRTPGAPTTSFSNIRHRSLLTHPTKTVK